MSEPGGAKAHRPVRWRNWAKTVSAVHARRLRPDTLDALSEAVQGAGADGLRVKALGSGHSFTAIGETSGVALDLSGWTGIVSSDPDQGRVTVRSGTRLRELNAELDALGLAMRNLGDIDAQTLAGAISTGTHGTGAGLGGLSTQVEALELILADGSLVRCSATERPELFSAARVGLGALGVIATVTLRCEPAFALQADERPEPLDAVLERFDALAAQNDHFELFWFPYGKNALVKRNNRLPPGTAPHPLSRARHFFEYELMENQAFGLLCRLGRAVPPLIKPLNRLSSAALSARSYSDTSHRVLVTRRKVRFVESEYGIPRAALPGVLAELRQMVPTLKDPVMFPVEVRVAAADDVWLSTAYGRDSAYVAIHQFLGLPYREYFDRFEAILGASGGRPHWGKLHTLGAEQLRGRYPRFDDFLRVRAQVDPQGLFRNAYLDRVLGLG
jgi:FAD-linked oxidoreductase